MRISLSFLSVGPTREYLARPLKLPSFLGSEIVDAIPSLSCSNAFESDMHVYSASTIYDELWSYCDARYKIAA